ncbi:MAG: class I SAM-dependent methyltransferase [Rubrobacteraceae bacterium]
MARGFARRGCEVVGLDTSEAMIEKAKNLDTDAGVSIRYVVGAAEETGFSDDHFEVVSAGQCWHWFDRTRTAWENSGERRSRREPLQR